MKRIIEAAKPQLTLSDIATQLVTVELPCGDCDSTGRQTNLRANPHTPNEPIESVGPCATCFGRGTREAAVCGLCGQEENGCEKNCKPTTCCQRSPVDCVCEDGIVLYRQAYGLAIAA